MYCVQEYEIRTLSKVVAFQKIERFMYVSQSVQLNSIQ